MSENMSAIDQREEALSILAPDQLLREIGYRLGLTTSCEMHEQGILTALELRRFEQLLVRKFSPIWGAFL